MKFRDAGFFLAIYFLAMSFPRFASCQSKLDIVYPLENQLVTAMDSTFIFGSVGGPNTFLRINDHRTRIYPNGTFLAYLPIRPGNFVFNCVAITQFDTVTVTRHVVIPDWEFHFPNGFTGIDSASLRPKDDLVLRSGDVLNLTFRGTAGLQAEFSIPGLIARHEMVEVTAPHPSYWGQDVFGEQRQPTSLSTKGVYRASYLIPFGVRVDSARVHFRLIDAGREVASAFTPGTVTIASKAKLSVAEVTTEPTIARTGPGLGYQLFLPAGVKLLIDGRAGAYDRARLGGGDEVWVPSDHLRHLSANEPVPSSTVRVVRTEEMEDRVAVRIYLQEKLPFKIEHRLNPSMLTVTVFGAISATDWIRNDFGNPLIEEVKWDQPRSKVYQVEVTLKERRMWGYNAFYDGTVLVVEIRKPPAKLTLKNLFVCVDPGHAPQDGAVGPSGLTERDANLNLAIVLKEKLEKKGATVFLTRKGGYGASLSVRTEMARYLGADLFLSLHHNALPDGVNPFKSRGTSTYYYHPQSRPLAAAIQEQLVKKLELPDFGLYYDNLAVCRITQMPSVLIEPAFIMHPEEEMLISTVSFQKRVADAIVKGLENFLNEAKK